MKAVRRAPQRPTNVKHQHGRDGEDLAVRHLEQQRYQIVERNWRPGNALRGEIDCIAWHGKVLCFVEIKTRAMDSSRAPQEAVTRAKQRQICALANAYVSFRRLSATAFRFDVVEVWLAPEGAARVLLHQNAFDYQEGMAPRRY